MARFKQKYIGGKDGNFLSFNIDENNLSNEVIFTSTPLVAAETDPIYSASPASTITQSNINEWNKTPTNWINGQASGSVRTLNSMAEGYDNYSLGVGAVAEGFGTEASGQYSHAEGFSSTASGDNSHAEGIYTVASGGSSHAEGSGSTASALYAHAEGYNTNASGQYSHAEGSIAAASGQYSHAEGYHTTASGQYSHAEGYYTNAAGNYSHADGYYANAQRRSQHAFGEYNILDTTGSTGSDKGSFIEIVGNGTSSSARSNARTLDWSGNEVLAGKLTVGTGPTNNMDVATKQYVDTATIGISEIPTNWINGTATGSIRSTGSREENSTYSLGTNAVAEGSSTSAQGACSHAEGLSTSAQGHYSHAEGHAAVAQGVYSHAEGLRTLAQSSGSHAEGDSTSAQGDSSHSEGYHTTASGSYSHAEGSYTIANHKSQHVIGEYNIADTSTKGSNYKGDYIEIVGNGTGDSARSNARTLDWSGNEVLAGKLTVGTGPINNMDVATKQYVDTATASIVETDPVFLTSPAANITSADITNWNNKLEQFIITFTNASEEARANGYSDEYQYFTCDKTISEIAAANQKGYKIVVNGIDSLYWNPENSNIITDVYEDNGEFECTIYYQQESSQKIHTTELYIESGEDYWTYSIESEISGNPFRLVELKWSSYHETISTETWNEIYQIMSRSGGSTGCLNIILYESKNEGSNTYYNYWYFESRNRISGGSPSDTLWFRQNNLILKLELYNRTVEIITYFPDWNENSSDNLSFIKNRTHYMEIEDNYKWLDNVEFSFTGTTKFKSFKASDAELFEIMAKANGFIENESYTITLNETTYNLQCYTDNDKKGYFIGNSTLAPTTFTFSENHNTEIPFVINILKSTFSHIGFYRDSNNILNDTTLTLTVEGPRRKYNNLNSNYLNGKLIGYGSTNGAEVFNDIDNNIASASHTHAEGYNTSASNSYAHAEGSKTAASGIASHAEGYNTNASGSGSHAEGYYRSWTLKFTGNANATTYTISAGTDSCPRLINIQNLDRISAAGKTPIAITTDENGRLNSITFSETLDANNAVNTNKLVNIYTKSEGTGSHAEGRSTLATGDSSHSGGALSEANGQMAFAHGQGIITNGANQTAFGKYNIVDSTSAFIVGNGTASAFSNAYTLDWNGNGVYAGKLTVGTGPTNNMDVATKQYVDTATAGITSNLSGLTDTTITSPTEGQILVYDSTNSKWVNTTLTSILPIYDGTVQNG